MTLFILDTDSASLFLAGNQQLIHRVTQAVPDKDFSQVPDLKIEDWTL